MISGLRPVIVQDADDGTVLMLAWADDQALEATRSTSEAHFWSRSRDELWHKGATSGNVMAVVDISVDCDEDTLLYSVHPTGPACHTGRHSCFDRPDTVPTQVSLSLETLERIIAERAGSASVDESYTARCWLEGRVSRRQKWWRRPGRWPWPHCRRERMRWPVKLRICSTTCWSCCVLGACP